MEGRAHFDPSEVYLYTGKGNIPRNAVRAEVECSVKFIPKRLFDGCDRLESVLFHEGLLGIGEWAFLDCKSLRNIHFPSTVKEICEGAFMRCSNLATIEPPEGRESGLSKIGEWAFDGCSSLRSIPCPSAVTDIGAGAFCRCLNLGTVELPNGLESIEQQTFRGCTSLEELKIPALVARIGGSAFRGCANLASVQLRNGLRTIGDGAFNYCSSLESISVPPSVVEIEENAFDGCSRLTLVRLHENLPNVKQFAFRGCPLESFQFIRLSERTGAIKLDERTQSMFHSRLREITLALTTVNHDDDWPLWNDEEEGEEEEEAESVREKCKESLGRAHEFLTYLELKGAAPVLELALWKAKIEGQGGEVVRGGLDGNEDGGQDPSDKGRERKRPKVVKNIDQDPRLSRKDCRVKCGAGIVIPEVLKFFTYSFSWPQLDDSDEGNAD